MFARDEFSFMRTPTAALVVVISNNHFPIECCLLLLVLLFDRNSSKATADTRRDSAATNDLWGCVRVWVVGSYLGHKILLPWWEEGEKDGRVLMGCELLSREYRGGIGKIEMAHAKTNLIVCNL